MTDTANDEYRDMATPLAVWLTEHLDGAERVEVGTFDRPNCGYSAETLIVPITVTAFGTTENRTIVLRREMPEPPVFDRVADELPRTDTTVLTWGDARLGNVIWQNFRPACLTDFEAAALAPPEMDLGWCLMFEQWSHALAGIDLLPGVPSRQRQVEYYSTVSNHEVTDIGPWVLFAAARYGAIVVRIMNRWVNRGLLDADQTVYLDPIAPVLGLLLEA